MIRKILGVIAGYVIFVVSALAFFKQSGHAPHADPTINFAILTAIYGAVFSFLSGLVVQLIARTNDLKVNYILALIISGFALFSLLKSTGNHWTQIQAIFIFAPVSILGGLLYLRRKNVD